MELQDWFLPALYQAGQDTPLLTAQAESVVASVRRNNLPTLQRAGFFGRSRELWEIEREFVKGTRRLAITGFGGQGKSYLAAEAGRWFQRTGMFQRVCWISYDAFQGIDAVEFAVSTLATVVEKNLPDIQDPDVVIELLSDCQILGKRWVSRRYALLNPSYNKLQQSYKVPPIAAGRRSYKAP